MVLKIGIIEHTFIDCIAVCSLNCDACEHVSYCKTGVMHACLCLTYIIISIAMRKTIRSLGIIIVCRSDVSVYHAVSIYHDEGKWSVNINIKDGHNITSIILGGKQGGEGCCQDF